METNKTGKYLKYAIGEVVLVMFGILLALSINNSNEDRKLAKQELSLLEEVKTNLETTLENFKVDMDYNYGTIRLYERINDYLEADLAYNEELDSAFAAFTFWSSPYEVSIAYKTLQNKGIDIIKNKSLKNSLVVLYDVTMAAILIDLDQSEWNLNQFVVMPFFAKNIRRINENSLNTARPNDFEKLKTDEEFLNILSMLIRQRRKGIEYYNETMIAIENVIKMIDNELESRG